MLCHLLCVSSAYIVSPVGIGWVTAVVPPSTTIFSGALLGGITRVPVNIKKHQWQSLSIEVKELVLQNIHFFSLSLLKLTLYSCISFTLFFIVWFYSCVSYQFFITPISPCLTTPSFNDCLCKVSAKVTDELMKCFYSILFIFLNKCPWQAPF